MGFSMKGFKYGEVKRLTPGIYDATIVKAAIEKSRDYNGFETEKLCVYFTYAGGMVAKPDCKRYDSRPEDPEQAEKWDIKFSRFMKSFGIAGQPAGWLGKTGKVQIKKMGNGNVYIDFPETFVTPEEAASDIPLFEQASAPETASAAPAPAKKAEKAPVNDDGFPEDIPF